MNPDPNGDQRGRPFSAPRGKMPNVSKAKSIVHERFTPVNRTEGVGLAPKSGGESPKMPKTHSGRASEMPVKR